MQSLLVTRLQRLDDDQRIQGLCVVFGDKKFEVKASESESGIDLQFGDLSLLGGGTYVSRIDKPTTLNLSSQWTLGEPIMVAYVDGKEVIVQVCVCHSLLLVQEFMISYAGSMRVERE